MPDTIVVASWWVNHPEMLEIHKKMWEATFLNDKVRYVVYIDSPSSPAAPNFGDTTMRQQLLTECARLGIEVYEVPEEYHTNRSVIIPSPSCLSDTTTASARDCVSTHMAWRKHILEECVDRYCMVQPDIFPYRRVNWNDITKSKAFMYKPQQRQLLWYAWNGLCCINRSKWDDHLLQTINFDWGVHRGIFTDSGGGTWRTLLMMPEEEKLEWSGLNSLQWHSGMEVPDLPFWALEHIQGDPRNEVRDGKLWYYSEIQHDWCVHLRAGCNWDGVGLELHRRRYERFTNLLKAAIYDGSQFL